MIKLENIEMIKSAIKQIDVLNHDEKEYLERALEKYIKSPLDKEKKDI
jgi:hypothetical protein